jgi:peptide/nickel transport system permease protein
MIGYVLQRLWQALFVLLAVTLIAFAMFKYLGDPLVAILGSDSTAAQRERVRTELGLDRPLVVQYGAFLARAAVGDFGVSLRLGRPVDDVLLERIPATVELAVVGMALALLIGIPAGIYTAVRRRDPASQVLLGVSLLGISLPSFFMGLLLIWVFSVTLGWLPSFGRGDTIAFGWFSLSILTGSGLRSIILPALTLAGFQVAMIMRLVRAEMLEVLRADFIRFARARGIRNRALYFTHALRNALVPVITITGLQLGSVIGFAVITEAVFQWPGLGLLFLQSIASADVAIMSAYLILVALVFVAINLTVDLLYYCVDPRLRAEEGADAMRR